MAGAKIGVIGRFKQVHAFADLAAASPQTLNGIELYLRPDMAQQQWSLLVSHSG